MSSKASGSSKDVNNLLHNLRGEQFRHRQNQRKSRTHISSYTPLRKAPTLPLDIIGLDYTSETPSSSGSTPQPPVVEASKKYSGPPPPKSWTSPSIDITATIPWRRQALSVIFREWKAISEPVLPLTFICLRMVLPYANSPEFPEEIVPYIPPHLRLQLVRCAAIYSPLSNSILHCLSGEEGHVDSELVVVGPAASIEEDHFLRDAGPTPDDWDTDDWTPDPLRTLVIMSTEFPSSSSFIHTLPPTITQLALINLPSPVPLHRIPGACPLIEVLDLSFNRWLQPMSEEVFKSLDKLIYLRILAVRESSIPEEILSRVNRARPEDVEIIR